MTRMISALAALLLALFLVPIAGAQSSTRVEGQVMDIQGNAWPDVTVQIKNADTGQTFTIKTDKSGKYSQLLPRGGALRVRASQRESEPQFHRET